MSARPWLRHPPATIRRPSCPTGRPRFASVWLAQAALTPGLAVTGLTARTCDQCHGAHVVPT
ncbi:hypothetical protein [Streptomyces sp. NPDC058466]|uniref:hypothetical protein n=1 Tax=Streptomyces sp. NPDC058466 TaxID=3346512 RepID=UPI003669E83D